MPAVTQQSKFTMEFNSFSVLLEIVITLGRFSFGKKINFELNESKRKRKMRMLAGMPAFLLCCSDSSSLLNTASEAIELRLASYTAVCTRWKAGT